MYILRGMPIFLRHVTYMQTPHIYKWSAYIICGVRLSGDAYTYVLCISICGVCIYISGPHNYNNIYIYICRVGIYISGPHIYMRSPHIYMWRCIYICTRHISICGVCIYVSSKLNIFNKNYEGLGTTEKEKKQEETQTGR